MNQNEVSNKLLEIGKQHKLTIEQIGRLDSIVKRVLDGKLHANDFVEAIETELEIEDDALTALARDVNVEIFLSMRQALINEQESESVEEKHPEREDILAEIENPTPSFRPEPEEDHMEAAHDFIGQNLAGNRETPVQRAAIEMKKKEPEKPKSYPSDPYREPLA